MSRRACLLGLAALPFSFFAAAAVPPHHVAVLDWAIAEGMIALGMAPAAIAERKDYLRQSATGPLPDSVIDLGLRDQVNLELLQQVTPDLILLPSWQMLDMERLSRIAPTVGIDVYGERDALETAHRALATIARHIHRQPQASAFIKAADDHFSAVRAALASKTQRSVQIVSFIDERHAWAYGGASLFHDVAERVGLHNIWRDRADHVVTVGFDALARAPDAWVVFTEPLQPWLLQRVQRNPLWQALPAVRTGRVVRIPPLLAFGGLATAKRFASELRNALAREAHDDG